MQIHYEITQIDEQVIAMSALESDCICWKGYYVN